MAAFKQYPENSLARHRRYVAHLERDVAYAKDRNKAKRVEMLKKICPDSKCNSCKRKLDFTVGRSSFIVDGKVLCPACYHEERKIVGKIFSRRYPACIDCGTTTGKHVGHGLCERCSAKNRFKVKKAEMLKSLCPDSKCNSCKKKLNFNVSSSFLISKGKVLCTDCYQENSKIINEVISKRITFSFSQKYPACIDCGTTTGKHVGHGLCKKCYAKYRYSMMEVKREENKKIKQEAQLKEQFVIYDLFQVEALSISEISKQLKNSITRYKLSQILSRLIYSKYIERIGIKNGARYKKL